MLLGFKCLRQKWNVEKKYFHKILKKIDTNMNYALFKECNITLEAIAYFYSAGFYKLFKLQGCLLNCKAKID